MMLATVLLTLAFLAWMIIWSALRLAWHVGHAVLLALRAMVLRARLGRGAYLSDPV
jgi:hypothetical protein